MFIRTEEKICMDLVEFSKFKAFKKAFENLYNNANDKDLLNILSDLMNDMDKFQEYIEMV